LDGEEGLAGQRGMVAQERAFDTKRWEVEC
jgi:hypothetical protein